MSNRRQDNRMRSEYGAATVLVLLVLMLCALAGIVPSGARATKGGASAQVINSDGRATEGGFTTATGSGSTSLGTSLIKAGSSKTASLQEVSPSLRVASNDEMSVYADAAENDGTSNGPGDTENQATEGDAVAPSADEDDDSEAEQIAQDKEGDDSSQGDEETDSVDDAKLQENLDESDYDSYTEEPEQQGERTIKKKLTCVNGTTYLVKLTFDEEANMPANAQLKLVELNPTLTKKQKESEANKDRPYDTERFVSRSALNQRGEVLDRWLELTDDDYRFFTKYVDVSIVADGKTVVPDAPVEVTIETTAIPRDKAGAIEVALKVPVDKPTEEDPFAYELLGGENVTDDKDSTSKVTFVTDEFGEFAVAGVAYSMGTWDVDDMTINVMGPRDLDSANIRDIDVDVDDGVELREAFTIDVSPSPAYGTTLWVSAKSIEGATTEGEKGGLYGYRIWRGTLADRLFEPKGTTKPVEFRADKDSIALVWDTGYRQQSLGIKKVTLDGMLPEGITANATSVRKHYRDLASISKKLTKAAEAEGFTLNTVAAYEISMAADGEDYQPSEENPLTVSISSIYISEDALYQVWHVRDNGSVEVVEDAKVEGDTVTFEATDLNVFMVVETTKETTLETADGKTYRVQVTYDNNSGVPEDAELEVSEIKEGQESYESYIEDTAQALDASVKDLEFARAFDITLKDSKTGDEYQPAKDVRVSIELLNEDVSAYDNVSVVHIPNDSDVQPEVIDASVSGDVVEFATDGFSVYVVTAYTVDFHWGDYTYSIAGESEITLSALLDKLGVTEITLADVTSVSFSNPDYIEIERIDSDWLLRSLAPFDTEEVLTLVLANGESVSIKVTDEGEGEYNHNPKVSITAGNFDVESETIDYTVTLEAKGDLYYDGQDHPVTLDGLVTAAGSILTLDTASAKYTYSHADGFAPAEGAPASQVNGSDITDGDEETFAAFPITVSNMYDGDKVVLSYTAAVVGAVYDSSQDTATVENAVTITNDNNASDNQDDNTASVVTSYDYAYTPLLKERTDLEGSWASWQITVNPKGFQLNGGEALTLKDNFNPDSNQGTDIQTIDYASIQVTGDGVSYDYRGSTGTFVIPDASAVTITYRTRIKAKPGDVINYGNVATLLDASDQTIAEASVSQNDTIYPSASDVATTTGVYMLKLYAYGNGTMETGISGAEFVLLDANARPITYKKGEDAGKDVTFATGGDGYVDIQLEEESTGLSIAKNTAYYLQMIKAPEGYRIDNTLYSFMITDDPDYNSGGIWTYYNGDTMKVRLYQEGPGLTVSLRFSGNHSLRKDQQEKIEVVLQKKIGEDDWEDVERHPYTDFSNGSMTFAADTAEHPLEIGSTYRVIQENELPWDLESSVILNATYYLIIGSANNVHGGSPIEFTVSDDNINSSFNVVINDAYEEPKFTLTKMDKTTGDTLSGAEFTVKKATDDTVVKTYTTDEHGVVVISGGPEFESETLYYVVETSAPDGYLDPLSPEKNYFYFCNDSFLEPSILENLPEGETAVNLSETFESLSIDNQQSELTIPVMKTWQDNAWPQNVKNVTIGLYQSVGGSDPVAVLDQNDEPRTVVLSSIAPYNNKAFTDLPARDGSNRPITYSIKEEHVTGTDESELLAEYVQEYGISDSGVYIVRNKPATTLTVSKQWYDLATNERVTAEGVLSQQPTVYFDVYRTTGTIPDDVREGGITNEEMAAFVNGLTKVRSKVSFGGTDNWETSLTDLDKYADSGLDYHYYAYEIAPSFGNELYEVNEDDGTVVIKNKTMPDTVSVTVSKAALVGDPRPESVNTEFSFTLALENVSHDICQYQVYGGEEPIVTNWKGEATFTLKPEENITLTLPVGVTATITEEAHPEYVEVGASENVTDTDTADRVFAFDVVQEANGATITYTNTLRVICKVIDNNNEQHPYESLKSALAHVRENSNLYGDTVTVYMLEDYTMPETDVFDVKPRENIILTTASTSDSKFPFRTDRTEQTETAIITRGGGSGSMFTNEGTLTLQNIILDGDGANTTVATNGGIVNSTGTLNVTDDATLQNSSVNGMGGAIYSTGTINMSNGSINDNRATQGSAIYLAAGTLNLTGGRIEDNKGAEDGAVAVHDTDVRINVSGDPVVFDNTNADGEWANIYLGADSDNVINILAPGLSSGDGLIGVRAIDGHREIGEQFASAEYDMTDNLNRFVNDLYEYRGKLKDGTSTNVVWDGLNLTIKKIVEATGANASDLFTITLSSTSLKRSTYAIDGTVDYDITPAAKQQPGTIEFRNVKGGDTITVSPLPVGDYKIEEAASNYSPTYSGEESGSHDEIAFDDGAFAPAGDSTVTVTNTRKLADVTLTKTMDDRLKAADEVQNFPFTIRLTEADDTPITGFELANGVTTNGSGEATITMSPTKNTAAVKDLVAPVGALMRIEEHYDSNYKVTTSAVREDDTVITDENTDDANVFAFTVTDDDDDAAITFSNVRKMAEIQLRKNLFNKVSATESFDFTVTLKDGGGNPVANFPLYESAANPENTITTDGAGAARIRLSITPEEGDTLTKAITLSIPEGTSLEVEEDSITKAIPNNTIEQEIYDTTVSINEGTPTEGTTTATIDNVSDSDHSIVFTNTRKMQTVVVSNTVNGYSGNVVPFTYTATVTDGGDDDYDINGFTDGAMTFELTTGQTQTLLVPYGATLNVTEGFIVGYETTVKHGSNAAATKRFDEFVVTQDIPASSPIAFTNNQLIGLRIVNNTSSPFLNVKITVGKNKIYRVNSDSTDQELIGSNKTATIRVEAGEIAILEIQHDTSVTAEQNYRVNGETPADGYYYTITNEPSFHEYANPAIQRVYGIDSYDVSGKLRYSVDDSVITFTEQPLVTFDPNGGVWTTEMDGYHDRYGNGTVYQKAVTTNEAVERPDPDPVYPTAEKIRFLGWTQDEVFAKSEHAADENVSAKLYDFTTEVTVPITLYAIWARDPDARVVTVNNGLNTQITINIELTNNDGTPVTNHILHEDTDHSEDSITTDGDGKASFTLPASEVKNLNVPQDAKLVISADSGTAYSTDFTDTDNVASSFTIDPVDKDGTVSFIGGICKITDADGNILYGTDGKPAVYSTLAAAFTAYVGNLYSEPAMQNGVTPAAVKMLVEDYTIEEATPIAFPNATMTFTTAGRNDSDFPYVGSRDRSAIYRSTAGASARCFIVGSGDTTLTEIILDGGSERDVRIAASATATGGLVYMANALGTLNINSGTTLRNCEYAAYSNASYSLGGAVHMTNGTLYVSAGLFSNLHAYQGGAICVTGGTLNVTGASGSTHFENCYAERGDGGAIYYKAGSDLVIDGGDNRGDPGIIFTECAASYTNGTGDGGDGGAIFASSNPDYSYGVTVNGCAFIECSARTGNSSSTGGYGGGAISGYKVKTLAISQSSFDACDTLCGGGAVAAMVKSTTAVNNDTVNFTECSFDQCNSKSQGGALAVYQDNNGATGSATRLSIINSSFTSCSSGTNNGSGGAIQCYLPCMVFTGSTFTDCWAGKEGGAVNNFYGSNYQQVWTNSSAQVTGCSFIRCRAEDRYDTTAVQHYGGGINTKAKIVTVTGSTFEDCVSTLREGGALHIGGQGGGSKATINGNTFKNCTAKNGGGAILSSHETLEINHCNFYGCASSASNGGAVYHYRNSRADSTQKYLTILNSTFSADPDIADSSQNESERAGCRAAQNGGAIWTRANTDVTLENLEIEDCKADNYGGAIYLDSTTKTASISDGSISGCQAVNGSAVYVGTAATFSGSLNVHDNTVSDINDGAIHGGKLYFEGNVTVQDNTCNSDPEYDHDVLMQVDDVTIIYTTANGLGSEAKIGVYVPDKYFNKRGLEGKAFGTYDKTTGNGSNYLDAFFNDRDDELFGYQMAENDYNIYWGVYVCKITDAEGNTLTRPNGRPAVYQRLTMAFGEFTSVTGGTPVYVKMLVENYNIKQTAVIDNFPAANITLTTAASTDAEHRYRGTEGTVCTISRNDSNTDRLFNLKTAGATFKLQDITLDGRSDKTATTGNKGLIKVEAGEVVVNGGTTLQYGYAGSKDSGAAIYSTGAPVTVNGVYDADAKEPTVKFVNCEVKNDGNTGSDMNNGGAIYASTLTITCSSNEEGEYGTSFVNCSSRRGGAIYAKGSTIDIAGAIFQDCHCASQGGAIYHDNASATLTEINNSAFVSCYTVEGERHSCGGAVSSRAGSLKVEDCKFDNCYARSNGGAINHGTESTNRVKTTISNTTFDGCHTTGTNAAYSLGGSVYTQAITVAIDGSSFTDSTATNHGGALYCQNNTTGSNASISGCTFENCVTTRTSGYGGAIYSENKALTIETSTTTGTTTSTPTTINSCMATGTTGCGGAIYMETSGSTLDVKDGTIISGCYANKGGAIYLIDGVTMSLSGSPEFTRNGYTTLNGRVINASQGACIYLAEGSKINLSGSPKFSRNNITDQGDHAQPRIANGGTTDFVRQDLYLAGYADKNATSINVTGDLTGDTIWVWPEQSPHQLAGEQFGIMVKDPLISDATLQMLRNALPDGTTHCTDGEYLAGVRHADDTTKTYVYWDKMYNFFFYKKDNKAVGVAGAVFTLYRDRGCTQQIAQARSADGETDTNVQGEELELGVVDFVSIPIGVYYMRETEVPDSFKANDSTYIVLVGTPSLNPRNNTEIWNGDGPLNVDNAETLVQQRTVNDGFYYGIFLLDSNGKADLSKNLVKKSVGIINIRKDFEAWFLKTDAEGAALPNAAFTIYAPILDAQKEPVLNSYGYPQMERWHRDGEEAPRPVTSADGTAAYKKVNGATLDKGVVYFRELPIGTYYLVETAYPNRNGNNRLTYFVEGDRVFKLDVKGVDADNDGVSDFTLSEWDVDDQTFKTCTTLGQYYVVMNEEAVCKLTDENGNLLYELGKLSLDGEETYHPAIYSKLEQGFTAAQDHDLYNAGKKKIGNDNSNPLKLQVLKDFTLFEPVNYSGARGLTFTTASRTATETDRYAFTTTRTTDTSRAEVKRVYSADVSTDANNMALITVNDGASLKLQNINLNGQKGSYTGRALHVTGNSLLNVQDNVLIHNFKQQGETADEAVRGGAILMDDGTALYIDGGTRGHTAIFQDNETSGNGGAIAIGEGCYVDIKNAQLLGNKANGNGGALYVASGVTVPLAQGTLRGNKAALGSAIYLEEGTEEKPTTLTMQNGSITEGKASDPDGGAINAGGAHAVIAFEGSPTVFNNVSASNSTEQRNVVLSEDSNGIIQTTQEGLSGGLIGVYVTGEIAGDQFQAHGLTGKPFGTFDGDKNLKVFRNDRNLALYGIKNDETGTIDWVHVICKLTDTSDNLLYQDSVFTINGTTVQCKAPAIYTTLKEGFTAVAGKLYTYAGDAFGDTSDLKLKMLGDVDLLTGVGYAASNRATIFTTAETEISYEMGANGDYFVFETSREVDDQPATTAMISRNYNGASLITASGKSLTLMDIVLDGDKSDGKTATTNGGLVNLSGGELVITTGAMLQNSATSKNGGAIYAGSGTTVVVEGGTINHNECTSDGNGAGVYVDGATIRLSGNPYFGGKGTDDNGDIITQSDNENAEGNWKKGAVEVLTNGTKDYTQYRQDLFVHGMTGSPAANIVLTGNVGYDTTGEFAESSAGSIWTWIDDVSPTHHKDKEQFAVVANGATVSEVSYTVFRNARDDGSTENSTDKYLTGVSGDDIADVTCVYWGPTLKGARRVILRKVVKSDTVTYDSLPDAVFTVWSGNSITKVDGGELKGLTSKSDGVFWIGELPYGTYYIQETAPSEKWFTLTVGDDTLEGSHNGVVISEPQDSDPRVTQG